VDNTFEPTVGQQVDLFDDNSINGLFEAAADSVEEAIYNVLTSAESMDGPSGHRAEALPLDTLRELMDKHYVPVPFV